MEDNVQLIEEIDRVNNLVWNLRTTPNSEYNPEFMLGAALKKAESINYQFGIAHSLLNLATFTFVVKSDVAFAEESFRRAKQIFQDLKNEKWIANSLLTHAIIKNAKAMLQDAIDSEANDLPNNEIWSGTHAVKYAGKIALVIIKL